MDLPVNQNSIDDFIQKWTKYDPEGTGFIKVSDLESFLKHLAEDNEKLFWSQSFRKVIANQNIDEDLSDSEILRILKSNMETRRRYLTGLEIPTYGNFQFVYFHDVLQMMTQLVVSFQYDKEKIAETKAKLNAIANIKQTLGIYVHQNQLTGEVDDIDAIKEVMNSGEYVDDF